MEDFPRDLLEFEARFSTEKACRVLLPTLRWAEELAEVRSPSGVLGLRLSRFGDGWDGLPGYAQALDALVPGGLVGHQPEERCECHGPATGARAEELQNRMDVAA
jgi:hypothetical protein